MNILDAPVHKIEDRRALAQRVFDRLLDDPDAQLDFKGAWKKLSPDEQGNWEARQHFANVLFELQPKEIISCTPSTHTPQPQE